MYQKILGRLHELPLRLLQSRSFQAEIVNWTTLFSIKIVHIKYKHAYFKVVEYSAVDLSILCVLLTNNLSFSCN